MENEKDGNVLCVTRLIGRDEFGVAPDRTSKRARFPTRPQVPDEGFQREAVPGNANLRPRKLAKTSALGVHRHASGLGRDCVVRLLRVPGFSGFQGQWHWPGGSSPPGFTFGIIGA